MSYNTYKYTKDKDRILFTKNGSKIADKFIELLKEIKWDWSYEGICTFGKATFDDDGEFQQHDFVSLNCLATLPKVPYFVFGGYVYELCNKEYGGLKQFLDPTGDVDVRVNKPSIKFLDNIRYDPLDFWYEDLTHKSLNTVMELYSNYLFDYLVTKISQMDIPGSVDFELGQLDGHIARSKKIGNIYVVKVYHPLSVKIQVVCKFEEMSEPDHLFEFVWLIKQNLEKAEILTNNRESNPVIHGVYVQELSSLIIDNVGSANDRKELHGTKFQHKWFNHVQRLKYLNHIFKHLIRVYEKDSYQKAKIGMFLCYMFLFVLKEDNPRIFSRDKVSRLSVIFSQLTSNYLQFVKENRVEINKQCSLIYKSKQRVSFSDDLVKKYFKDNNIDLIISDIESLNNSRGLSLKPKVNTTYKRKSLPKGKTRNNFDLDLKPKTRRRSRSLM